MPRKEIPEKIMARIREAQRSEITEYHIYSGLARIQKRADNRKLLQRIADDEKRHYDFWRSVTGSDMKPRRGRVWYFYWIARILGITFGIKLMERGEGCAAVSYGALGKYVPKSKQISREESAHERELIGLISEEKLVYVGSIVLGLNDALIELTGTLAGLTLALRNTRVIALAGLITGIAAAFSMAASDYLSTKAEGNTENALKSSVYTGITYLATVMLLIMPYLIIGNYFICLALTLGIAVTIIFLFNYYISVAKDYPFRKRFFEMAALSLGIAGLSFVIGYCMRLFLGVDA
jgi:vacuolar iron transporter family protein